jgi:hypothetical protein
VSATIARALARDAGERFASMDLVAAALEPFAELPEPALALRETQPIRLSADSLRSSRPPHSPRVPGEARLGDTIESGVPAPPAPSEAPAPSEPPVTAAVAAARSGPSPVLVAVVLVLLAAPASAQRA